MMMMMMHPSSGIMLAMLVELTFLGVQVVEDDGPMMAVGT
jgi:hypothetical protein